MKVDVYRFQCNEAVRLDEVEATLHLALLAAEGLFGRARVRLEFSYFIDQPRRTFFVDGTTEVGAAVVRIFTGLLLEEFPEEAFEVRRVDACRTATTQARC